MDSPKPSEKHSTDSLAKLLFEAPARQWPNSEDFSAAASDFVGGTSTESNVLRPRAWTPVMSYAVTIFLGAFLLFQIQPIVGKFILPRFGGVHAVWTTCVLFFQVCLLGGYAYAHALNRTLDQRKQVLVHGTFLILSLLFLPIRAGGSSASPVENPAWEILLVLAAGIGLPFVLLSATSPLIQGWFHGAFPDRSPYRLFALSNAGSLIALLSFPFVVEPVLSRTQQSQVWSWSYAAFVAGCLLAGYWVWRKGPQEKTAPPVPSALGGDEHAPNRVQKALWFGLSACASVLLLAVTNQICLNLPSTPFLWVLPLSLYLASFVLCFEWERLYKRPLWLLGLLFALAGATLLIGEENDAPIWLQVFGFSGALFLCCMVCHGELSLWKPKPRYLTSYYLSIAAGGAAGGVAVGLMAPMIFPGFFELHAGILLCACLALASYFFDPRCELYRGRPVVVWGILLVGMGFLTWELLGRAGRSLENSMVTHRDFYGVLRVVETQNENSSFKVRYLVNGSIHHGFQLRKEGKPEFVPTSYYASTTGIGELMARMSDGTPRRIGVVGLGVGTIAAYGNKGDHIRFYEISPAVVGMARKHFSFLEESQANVEIVLGDARISLAGENDQEFDVLALDAFQGDSIPVHLLTKEALEVYFRHLRVDGVLAFHISNKYVNLYPALRNLAAEFDIDSVYLENQGDRETRALSSEWFFMSRAGERLKGFTLERRPKADGDLSSFRDIWTDEFSSLYPLLR